MDGRADLPNDDYVFILHNRSPSARTIQRRLATDGERSDVKVSPHRLRLTIATRLINQGMPIHLVKKLLGRQRLDTTQLYARVYDDTLYHQVREANSRLEAIAVDAWPGLETGDQHLIEFGLESAA